MLQSREGPHLLLQMGMPLPWRRREFFMAVPGCRESGMKFTATMPLLTVRKGDSERDQLSGAQGLEAEDWAFPSGWLLEQLHICL